MPVDTIKAIVNQDSNSKGYSELEEENKKLRGYLREMNETLNKLLERQGLAKLAATKKNTDFDHKPVEDQLRTFVQEISNNEKIIRIKTEEFQRVKARLATLKNANYVIEVDEKIEQGKKQIEDLQKENKDLKVKNLASGKDLDSIENVTGAPQNIVTANQLEKELILLKRKNEKMKKENSKFDEQVKEQMKRIAELEAQVEKLGSLASHHGIELNVSAEKQRFLALMKEVKEQEDLLKAVMRRNDKYMENFFHRELEELKLVRMRDEEHLAKLEQMMDDQSVSLKDLLSRESLQGDKSVRDLFSKPKMSTVEPKQDAEKKIAKASPLSKSKFVKKTIQTQPSKEEPLKGLHVTSPNRRIAPLDSNSKKLLSDHLPKAEDLHPGNLSQDHGSELKKESQTHIAEDTKNTKEDEKKFDQDVDLDEEALRLEEEEIQRQEKLLEEQREQEALRKRQEELERQIREREEEERKRKEEKRKAELRKKEEAERIKKEQEEEAHDDAQVKEQQPLKLPEKTKKDKIMKLDNELEDTPISDEKFKTSQNSDPLKLPEPEIKKEKKELFPKPVEYQPQLRLNFDDDKQKKPQSLDNKTPKDLIGLQDDGVKKSPSKKPGELSHIKGESSVFINPSDSKTRKKADDDDGLLFDDDDQQGSNQKKFPSTTNKQTKNEGLAKKEVTRISIMQY